MASSWGVCQTEKGTLETNARLVLVETGEILGAVTKQLKKTWIESEKTDPSSVDPLDGWRLPTDLEPSLSTSTQPGTVIYKNSSLVGSDPKIKLILVEEDPESATFDLEYYLPPAYQGKTTWIYYGPGRYIKAPVGQNMVRVSLSVNEHTFFWAISQVSFVIVEECLANNFRPLMTQETIPFRKIMINSSWKGRGIFPQHKLNHEDLSGESADAFLG